jgi:cell division septation protein DedD
MLLRIPRTGGRARAYLYPKLDSAIWAGDATSIERVLGFDAEGGTLAIVNANGEPARLDLLMGEATLASKSRLVSLASTNGTDIYGVNSKGEVIRLTRSDDWKFTPSAPAKAVFPEGNGELVIASARGGETMVIRIHPPESKVLGSTVLRLPLRNVRAHVGDRVYFGTDTGLVGVKVRDLSIVPPIHLHDRVVALAPTPSGDRMYVAMDGENGVSIIDRYTDKVESEVKLPGAVAELRMDPLGRYVIARPVRGDSAWVIAVATDRLVGSVQTRWTADLPACAPDGAIAINTGQDVVFLDGETLQSVRTIVDGAKDFWYFMFWNGFRARAPGLDQPVSFARADTIDSTAVHDSAHSDTTAGAITQPHDSTKVAAQPTPAAPAKSPSVAPVVARPAGAVAQQTFLVSFATLLNEQKAREMARSISVNGAQARVIPTQRAGTMVYRVVLGPYPSRESAEQIGKAAQRVFWIYPSEP